MLRVFVLTFAIANFNLLSRVAGWPTGTYGLIKPATGCPDGAWYNGSRTFDQEDNKGRNRIFPHSAEQILAGAYKAEEITMEFCMKTISSSTSAWPKGSYCILKYGDCPGGFHEGVIYWDDEDDDNANSHTGVMPAGTYDTNTEMFFCCRDDGENDEPAMSLPSSKPFILLRYGNRCQPVLGMDKEEIDIFWDAEDVNNKDSVGGFHPFDDGGPENHQLHFCHYQPNGGNQTVIIG